MSGLSKDRIQNFHLNITQPAYAGCSDIMIIETFVLTPFQQNTRVVVCEDTRKAIGIDPGEQSDAIVSFSRFLKENP